MNSINAKFMKFKFLSARKSKPRDFFLFLSSIFFLAPCVMQTAWSDIDDNKPECSLCENIHLDIDDQWANLQENEKNLKSEKKTLQSLGNDQDSQRTKLTTHLIVLAAKSETYENRIIYQEKRWKFNCSKCPGVKEPSFPRFPNQAPVKKSK